MKKLLVVFFCFQEHFHIFFHSVANIGRKINRFLKEKKKKKTFFCHVWNKFVLQEKIFLDRILFKNIDIKKSDSKKNHFHVTFISFMCETVKKKKRRFFSRKEIQEKNEKILSRLNWK